MPSTRRQLLAGTALALLAGPGCARTIEGALPWSPGEAYPPARVRPGPWQFFSADEAATVGAIADRFLPPDDLGPGGRDAGCAVFIDRQLAGPYGRAEWWYMAGPFGDSTPSQGYQHPDGPAAQYRRGLAALNAHARDHFGGRYFHQLGTEEQDALLAALEQGRLGLRGIDEKYFFGLLLDNVTEGFFADPIYGGNRDMAGWKLVGFPGTRYDYRDVVARPNQPYTLPPVALTGRPEWVR